MLKIFEFEKGVKPKKIITSFLDNYFSDEEEKNAFLKGVKNICIGGEKWEKNFKNFTGANERVDI